MEVVVVSGSYELARVSSNASPFLDCEDGEK